MGITHKKRLFAKHFARTKDRRGSIEAAGYSLTDWPRQASRLLADPEVLRLIELEQDKEVRREQAGNMALSDVIAELQEMYQAADEKPGRSGWSAKLKVLEVLGRLVSGKREETQPIIPDDPKLVTDDQLRQRIAELEDQLSHGEKAITALDSPQPQPQPRSAAEQPPNAINGPPGGESGSEAKAKAAPLNMPRPDVNERLSQCPQHGDYLATRNRVGHWSFCPKCVRAWQDNEDWLRSLAPAGDGRK